MITARWLMVIMKKYFVCCSCYDFFKETNGTIFCFGKKIKTLLLDRNFPFEHALVLILAWTLAFEKCGLTYFDATKLEPKIPNWDYGLKCMRSLAPH